MLTTQYLKQQEEYSEKYGDKTVVLMQIGNFYEVYEFSPKESDKIYPWPNKKIGNVKEVATLLNLTITRKDKKKPYSLENCAMAGFPIITYEKHRDVLLANNYTIVRIDQKKQGKDVKRFVSEILSPATFLENISTLPINNNIVSIYIEVIKETIVKENYVLAVGLSCIDVTTGENSILEIYSKENDAVYALHEIFRYLTCMRPRQLLLTLKNDNKNKEYEDFLVTSLELNKIEIFILNNKVKSEYLKLEYQKHFLSDIFKEPNIKNNPNIIEELGLERIYYGTVSYVILLNYCYEHNTYLVEKLKNPNTSWLDVDNYLVLTHNAINQLDILPSVTNKTKHNRSNKNIDSLLSVVNYTKTSLGKRYLISRLTHPITDVVLLNETYNMVENLINHELLVDDLRSLLKEIPDLERYQRKLYLKLIKPHEFNILFQGYIKIAHIYTKIYNTKGSLYKLLFDSSDFNKCLQKVTNKYKLEVLSKCKIVEDEKLEFAVNEKIFNDGKDEKFDNYWHQITEMKKQINRIVDLLNSYLESTKGKKLVYEEKKIGLFTTSHKAKVLEKSNYDRNVLGVLQFTNTGKDTMINSDIISKIFLNYINLNEELAKYLYSCYNVTISDILKYNFFETLTTFISKVDFICSNAKCAIENKYFKPEITEEEKGIQIKDLRHPIVECLISDKYITNDVSLNNSGILLYGQNSSGKSTLGKAIALNLILAQAGLYTACKIKFSPYQKIITRLSGHDSVMTGESSFIIEMKELRTILRNADDKTLVIADEIARGTESISATSLSAASIIYLLNQKSSFIFSTHLHNLVDIKEVISPRLKICHLSLRYDGKKLIYDRKLKDGHGNSIYGLEVANSLGLDKIFMNKAYEIRNNLESINVKKSRYNSKVYLDSCFICGKRKNLETHHIEEQNKSDKNGFIEHMHKNIPGNLIGICQECHDYLHANGLSVVSEETSKGIALNIA